MREAYLEKILKIGVERLGGMCLKFTSPSHSGVPDRIVLWSDGRVEFIELKTDKGDVSRLQAHTIQEMQRRGASVHIVRGLDGVKDYLEGES